MESSFGTAFEPHSSLTADASVAMEQCVLDSFLREVDIADVDSVFTAAENVTRAEQRPVKKPTPSWKRRKEELQRLKSEVQALETQLAFLGLARVHKAMMNATTGLSHDLHKWKTAAKTEKQEYHKAKQENARLKAKLRKCMKLCASFRQALSQNCSDSDSEFTMADALVAMAQQVDTRMDCQLPLPSVFEFNMLESVAEARVDNLADILSETLVLHEIDSDQVQVRRKTDEETVDALVITKTRLVPFEAEKTSEAMWNVMKLGVESEETRRITRCSEDTRASEGILVKPLKCGGSVQMRTRCFMRRIDIPNGHLVLLEAISDWRSCPKYASEWKHVSRDSGFALVYPVSVASDGSTPAVCQLRTSICLQTAEAATRAKPYQNTPSLLSRAVTDVVVLSFREILNSRSQLLDNMLLDM